MASDKSFKVAWRAGKLTLHASSEKEACEIALEYIRSADNKLIEAQLAVPKIEAETV